MIELPNSTLIGKGFGCLVIKCEGDDEMEVGKKEREKKDGEQQRRDEKGNEDRKESRGREEREEGRFLEKWKAREARGSF